MRVASRTAFLGCIVAVVTFGQPAAFDAASVKVVSLASHPTFGNSGGPGTSDPGRIHLCCVGMYSLLMRAFDVQLDQIAGPSWIMDNMGPNLYQIDATIPPKSQGGDPTDFASRKARVIDKTGLTGKYSFTLEFSCEGCRTLGANASSSATPADPAGSGLPDIFAAIEKQLGLRLVKTKDIPLDVIVVDRVDRIPTGN